MGTKFGTGWWIADDGFLGKESAQSIQAQLGKAAETLFPDEYTPTVFLTGDAHRLPPFQWATGDTWADFFRPLINDNLVVCHVEQHQSAVNHSSVPPLFAPVLVHGKVFGWEHAIFPIVAGIINRYYASADTFPNRVTPSAIHELVRDTSRVAGMGYLRNEDQAIFQFSRQIAARSTRIVNGLPMANPAAAHSFLAADDGRTFKTLYSDYCMAAMQLRTDIHSAIAPSIQRRINQYADHLHLITCGDAHLIENPLYQYLEPPIGCFGVVDKSRH